MSWVEVLLYQPLNNVDVGVAALGVAACVRSKLAALGRDPALVTADNMAAVGMLAAGGVGTPGVAVPHYSQTHLTLSTTSAIASATKGAMLGFGTLDCNSTTFSALIVHARSEDTLAADVPVGTYYPSIAAPPITCPPQAPCEEESMFSTAALAVLLVMVLIAVYCVVVVIMCWQRRVLPEVDEEGMRRLARGCCEERSNSNSSAEHCKAAPQKVVQPIQPMARQPDPDDTDNVDQVSLSAWSAAGVDSAWTSPNAQDARHNHVPDALASPTMEEGAPRGAWPAAPPESPRKVEYVTVSERPLQDLTPYMHAQGGVTPFVDASASQYPLSNRVHSVTYDEADAAPPNPVEVAFNRHGSRRGQLPL